MPGDNLIGKVYPRRLGKTINNNPENNMPVLNTCARGALWLSRVSGSLFAIMLLLMPLSASAALDRAALERMQLDIWRIRADFHMHTVMAGDREYHNRLRASVEQGRRTYQALVRAASSDQERGLFRELGPQWDLFVRSAERAQGQADTYAIQDLNRMAAIISERLAGFQTGNEGAGADLWALAAQMQRMASEYLALAADPAGGMAVDTGEGRLEFRDAVPAFEQQLAGLRRTYRNQENVSRALDEVTVKWGFIRESLIKFYENAVPYLVHRYSEQIIDTLKRTAERTD